MKVAVVGSRKLTIEDLGKNIPTNTTEIISGGAKEIDTCAREYALSHNIKLTEYLPEYKKYGRSTPIKRNITIIENADLVIAFWDGKSRGTKFVIDKCHSMKIRIIVYSCLSRSLKVICSFFGDLSFFTKISQIWKS